MIGYLYSIFAGWIWIGARHYWLPVLLSLCLASERSVDRYLSIRPIQQQGSFG